MQKLLQDIKNKEYSQIYLLYGDEAYLRKQYRDKMKEALIDDGDTMNNHYYEGKDTKVEEIIDLAETLPFFASRRVIVIENSGWFQKGGIRSLNIYLSCLTQPILFLLKRRLINVRNCIRP